MLPLFVRQFIYDAIAGVIAAVIVLNLAFPTSPAEAQSQAILIWQTAATAVSLAAVRNAPAFLLWLQSRLGLAGA